MNKYLEKYTMSMIFSATLFFMEEVGLPPDLPLWKQLIVGFIFLPATLYILGRINDTYSTDIDEPFFTWKKFGLFLSMILGITSTLLAAILLGYM